MISTNSHKFVLYPTNWYVWSGNRKDLKCVRRRHHRLCQLIPVYVHYYYVNTVQYYFTRQVAKCTILFAE